MTPTSEQLAIVDAAANTSNNLIVSALAGAAKTSTLILVANALPSTRILSLAFNKKIATEMQDRLPSNCTAMTLNSLGHRMWADALGRKLNLETSKTYNILTDLIKTLSKREQEEVFPSFTEILQTIDWGKGQGYIPDGTYSGVKRLMTDDDLFAASDEKFTGLEQRLIIDASKISLAQAHKGTIDFNDQLLLPTLFPALCESYPLVMIDEAQDLSALNHVMLAKIAKKRLIAVGDQCQAIYGFRGAHGKSMEAMKEKFSMKELFLSVSFRCPRRVVESAQWRAPQMKYPNWAKEGEIHDLTSWTTDIFPHEAAIICRNNAPLFSLAIKLLKHGRYPKLLGNDIGKYLLKVMKKFGKPAISQAEVLDAIAAWGEEKKKKVKNISKVDDQMECLRIFAKAGANLGAAMAYAEHIFNSQGPIQLMTGHKSKGLEFEHVYILDRNLIRTGEDEQEDNLLYVMQTRAKATLTYIYSKDLFEEGESHTMA